MGVIILCISFTVLWTVHIQDMMYTWCSHSRNCRTAELFAGVSWRWRRAWFQIFWAKRDWMQGGWIQADRWEGWGLYSGLAPRTTWKASSAAAHCRGGGVRLLVAELLTLGAHPVAESRGPVLLLLLPLTCRKLVALGCSTQSQSSRRASPPLFLLPDPMWLYLIANLCQLPPEPYTQGVWECHL